MCSLPVSLRSLSLHCQSLAAPLRQRRAPAAPPPTLPLLPPEEQRRFFDDSVVACVVVLSPPLSIIVGDFHVFVAFIVSRDGRRVREINDTCEYNDGRGRKEQKPLSERGEQ